MNVEFLIHGTLTGQAYWKDIDKDYCSRAYTPRQENVVLEAEIVKHDNGRFSCYYNYLRYNNIVSTRTGAYFGMTVRMDDTVYCDMCNMYNMLDTLFNKCVVGILLKRNDSNYVYTCNSFEEKDKELKDIEKKFANMFTALMAFGNDFVPIPSAWNYKSGVVKLNDEDAGNVRDTLLSGMKVCVSPLFPSKLWQKAISQSKAKLADAERQIKVTQEECEGKIQAKTQELVQANKAASADKTKLEQDIKHLKEQLQAKESELKNVRADFSKQKLNAEISQTAKELKEPLKKLAGLMAERFPETDYSDYKVGCAHGKKSVDSTLSSFFVDNWIHIATFIVVLAIAAEGAFFAISVINGKDKQIADLKEQITQTEKKAEPDADVQEKTDKTTVSAKYTTSTTTPQDKEKTATP